MPDDLRMLYAVSDDRSKYRIAAENPKKYELVQNIVAHHRKKNDKILVIGTFGSRQEEAQRLGRILRPKKDCGVAHFYSIVTKDSKDQDFSANRQMFLTEQGYRYRIMDNFDTINR